MSLSMGLFAVLGLALSVTTVSLSGVCNRLGRQVYGLKREIDALELKVINLQCDRWMDEWDRPGSSDGGESR